MLRIVRDDSDKPLPDFEPESERALLACCLYVEAARSLLVPDRMSTAWNRHLAEEILASSSPDIVGLAVRMRDRGWPNASVELTELVSAPWMPSSAAEYAEAIARAWWRRRTRLAAQELGLRVAHGQETADAWRALEEARLGDAGGNWTQPLDLTGKLDEPDYLVPELGMAAGQGPPHMIAGYGYSGKTVAVQSLLLSLATGAKVWGAWEVRKIRRVVHVDLEQGAGLTQRRYQRLARAMGVTLESRTVSVYVHPVLKLTERYYSDWLTLAKDADLIVLDSFRVALTGDENSSEARAGLDMLGRLPCRSLVIHHATKPQANGEGGGGGGERDARHIFRGSGAIFDAIDGGYALVGSKGAPSSLVCCKAKSFVGDPTEIPDAALSVEDVPDPHDPRWGLMVRLVDAAKAEEAKAGRARAATADRIVHALRSGPMSVNQLKRELRLSGSTYSAGIGVLKGRVVEELVPSSDGPPRKVLRLVEDTRTRTGTDED